MFNKSILICLILSLIIGCDNKEQDLIYRKMNILCGQLMLDNCVVEVKSISDTKRKTTEKLVVNFEKILDNNSIYKQNLNYLYSKIVYEIYNTIDSIDINPKYLSIDLIGLINGEKIGQTYLLEDMKVIYELINKTNEFFIAVENKDSINLRAMTNQKYISDSVLTSIRHGVEHMEKCGRIQETQLLGWREDKSSETGEKVIVIERFVVRESSKEQFTFYITSKDEKIVFIDMKSSMDCL